MINANGKKIQIFDTTLRDGEQTIGVNFSIAQKIQIAQQLEKWGVDVIEAGFPVASPDDFKAVKAVAESVDRVCVTGLARAKQSDIDACVKATANAKHKQIHVFIGTSPIHRKDKLHMTKAANLAAINKWVRYARQFFDIVQFSPEDATRTEPDYLATVCNTAIEAGATVINIADTVGYTNPIEFGKLFDYLRAHVDKFDEVTFSVHCHDDLGMSVANAIAGVEHGASRIEGTVNGIGERAGNTALEEVAAAFMVRNDYYHYQTNINLKETKRTADMISEFTKMPIPHNKAVIGQNAFSHESGIHQDGMLKNRNTYEILTPESVGMGATHIILGKLSGSHAVMQELNHMGYEVTREDMVNIFPAFKAVADKQPIVNDHDLAMIMERMGVMVHAE
ncbi:2-isopropylmalate synthase [Nicoliella spurrieriana]|uniref:2-isopropylmalate synthase n=1 Tax=Nicoliella spurrieriana TaxID=2925830 RepID=A0A976X683_9LACO|nr:2-isopropylmalate synthase [Nicoliella spurrieriana]UQS87314.1 2-isopropylmalate synthase [Nicoliella spurrieriana]